MKTSEMFCVLALILALAACSGSKDEKKPETVKFAPSGDSVDLGPAKDQDKAKMPENVRKLIERENALTAKRKANPNASDKELYGSDAARPAAPKW